MAVPGVARVYQSSAVLVGESFESMKRNYELRCDKEFFAHVCAEHFTSKGLKKK